MIKLFQPHMSAEAVYLAQQVLQSGELTEGDWSSRFEKDLCDYFDTPNVVLTNSATSALTLAAHLAGIGPGSNVAISNLTCSATVQPFYNAGANLFFVNPEVGVKNGHANLNGDFANFRLRNNNLTYNFDAAVGVMWGGKPLHSYYSSDCGIIDGAHCFSKKVKDWDMGVLSFQAIKFLTTCDGGALICSNPMQAERARKLRWFGLDRRKQGLEKWNQDIPESGYKFHMNNLNAAIGHANLKTLPPLLARQKKIAKFYSEEINNDNVAHGKFDPECCYWLYTIFVKDTAHFMKYMADNGVESSPVHHYNHQYSCFKDRIMPGSHTWVDNSYVNIPVRHSLSDSEVELIAELVNKYWHLR